MSALTGPRAATTKVDVGPIASSMGYPVKGNAKIFAGAIVALGSDGFAKPATAATGLVIAGRAERSVDATGLADGALFVTVSQGLFAFDVGTAGDALTIGDRGKVVYAMDDHTVGKTDGGAARSPAGILADVQNGQAIVEMRPSLSPSMLSSENPASGPAGGDLSGTYPNPAVAALAITNAKMAVGAAAANIGTGATAPTGNTHTTAAGAGAAVLVDTAFDGGTGVTSYTVGDLVKLLKAGGIIKP